MGKDITHLANHRVHHLDFEDGCVFIQKVTQSSLGIEIKEKQMLDPILLRINGDVSGQKVMVFGISGGCTLLYQGRLYALEVESLQATIWAKAHESQYIIHSSLMKIYLDLKEMYCWNGIKRYVDNFVA